MYMYITDSNNKSPKSCLGLVHASVFNIKLQQMVTQYREKFILTKIFPIGWAGESLSSQAAGKFCVCHFVAKHHKNTCSASIFVTSVQCFFLAVQQVVNSPTMHLKISGLYYRVSGVTISGLYYRVIGLTISGLDYRVIGVTIYRVLTVVTIYTSHTIISVEWQSVGYMSILLTWLCTYMYIHSIVGIESIAQMQYNCDRFKYKYHY